MACGDVVGCLGNLIRGSGETQITHADLQAAQRLGIDQIARDDQLLVPVFRALSDMLASLPDGKEHNRNQQNADGGKHGQFGADARKNTCGHVSVPA